jgi:act minimal PKS acyl carrier protein
MPTTEFTIDDLRRIIREGAGADEDTDLGGDIEHIEFTALGYDSIALLETGTRIEREYRIKLSDAVVNEAATPAKLIAVVNTALAQRASA